MLKLPLPFNVSAVVLDVAWNSISVVELTLQLQDTIASLGSVEAPASPDASTTSVAVPFVPVIRTRTTVSKSVSFRFLTVKARLLSYR